VQRLAPGTKDRFFWFCFCLSVGWTISVAIRENFAFYVMCEIVLRTGIWRECSRHSMAHTFILTLWLSLFGSQSVTQGVSVREQLHDAMWAVNHFSCVVKPFFHLFLHNSRRPSTCWLNAMRSIPVCCSVLQNVAVCCSAMQCGAVMFLCVAVCCSVWCVAVCCSPQPQTSYFHLPNPHPRPSSLYAPHHVPPAAPPAAPPRGLFAGTAAATAACPAPRAPTGPAAPILGAGAPPSPRGPALVAGQSQLLIEYAV